MGKINDLKRNIKKRKNNLIVKYNKSKILNIKCLKIFVDGEYTVKK